MKFVCLGYLDEARWEALSEGERLARMEECFAYDDELRRSGHLVVGEAVQGVRHAVALRQRGGRIEVDAGPFAGTKERLGRILVLEARDLNHAIRLISLHPWVRGGTFEIRPAEAASNAQAAAGGA